MGGAGAADPANTRSLNYGANENKAIGANVFNSNNTNETPAFIRITAIRGKNAGSSHGLMTLENGEEIVVGQVISRADFERIFWNASKSDGSFSFVPVQDAQGTTAPNTVEQTVVIKTPDPLAPGSNPGTSSGEGGNTGHEASSQTGAGSGTGSSTGNGANTGANAGTGTANNGTDPNNTTGQQSGNDKGDGTAQNTGSPSGAGETSNQSASSGDGTTPAGGKPGAEGSGSENKPVTGSGNDSTSGSASDSGSAGGSDSTSGSDRNKGSGSDKGGSTPSEGQSSQASNGQAPSQNAGGQGSESQPPAQTPGSQGSQGSSDQTTSPTQGSPSGEQTPAQNTAGQGSESQPPAQTPGSQGSSEQTTSPTQGSPSGEQTPAQNTAGQGSESQPPAQTPGSQGSSEQTTSPTQGSSSGEQTPPQNAGGGSDTGTPGAGESTQTGGAQTGSAQTGTSETESSGTGDNGKQTSDGGQNGAADGDDKQNGDGDAKHEGDGAEGDGTKGEDTKGEDGEQSKNGEDTASPSNPPTTTPPPTPPDYAPNQSVQQAIHANNKPVGASIFNGTNPAHAPSFVKITAVLDKDGGEVSDAMTLGKEGEAITTDQVISKEQFDNVFLDALKAPGGSFKFIPVMDSEGTEMPGATEQTVSIGFDYVHHFQSEPFREGYEGEDRFSYYRIHSLTEHQDTNGTLDGMFKLDGGERTTLKLGDLIRPEDFDKLYWDYSSNNGGRFTLVGVDASGRDLTDEKNQNMVLEDVAKTRTGRLPPDEPGGEETDVEDSEDSNDIAGHSAALHPESFTDAASAFHGSSHLSVNGQSTLDNLLEHQVSHGIL